MEGGKLEQIEFAVQGMTWMGWEPKVLQALEGLPGVVNVLVSYPEKKATVTYNVEAIDFDRMKKALLGIGYVASIAEDSPRNQNIVGHKSQENKSFQAEDLVCYCFEYTRNQIEQDYIKNGKSTIMAKIAAEKKAGGCKCATENPKGRWCLVDVRQVVDKVKGKSSFNVIHWTISDRKDLEIRLIWIFLKTVTGWKLRKIIGRSVGIGNPLGIDVVDPEAGFCILGPGSYPLTFNYA